jgi:hypothetical protein
MQVIATLMMGGASSPALLAIPDRISPFSASEAIESNRRFAKRTSNSENPIRWILRALTASIGKNKTLRGWIGCDWSAAQIGAAMVLDPRFHCDRPSAMPL